MRKNKEIAEMREALIRMYPSGIIRNQFIFDMSDAQVYAIYKWHTKHKISTKKPRMMKPKPQVPGQTSLF